MCLILHAVLLPTMPENVTASEVNATSATLTWEAPSVQGSFNVIFYRVRLLPPAADEVIETTVTETYVSGLLPGVEYTVIVAAVVNDTSLLPQEVEIESLPFLFNTSVSGLTSIVRYLYMYIPFCIRILCCMQRQLLQRMYEHNVCRYFLSHSLSVSFLSIFVSQFLH